MAGMAFGDIVGAAVAGPSTIVPATASADAPASAKGNQPGATAQDAKQTLLLSCLLVVVGIAILGFGSRYLNNLRIA